MDLRSLLAMESTALDTELIKIPNKRIVKVGTQFCIRTDGVDKNLGCFPSREKAESVMSGHSFIEPDLQASKKVLSPVTKLRDKITMKVNQNTGEIGMADVKAGGPGSGRKPSHGKGLNKWKSRDEELKRAAKDPKQMKLPFKAGGPGSGRHPEQVLEDHGWQKVAEADHSGGIYKHPQLRNTKIALDTRVGDWRSKEEEGTGGASLHQYLNHLEEQHSINAEGYKQYLVKLKTPKGVGHHLPNQPMNKNRGSKHRFPNPKMLASDYGEPMAGAMQHAHLDTNMWFHPPSLKNADKIPTDDPKETNNRFLDVTKRNSKGTKDQRNKLLKRSAPSGTPPNVPVRTTLTSPTLNSYFPLHASVGRRRRREGGGMFRRFGSAKI